MMIKFNFENNTQKPSVNVCILFFGGSCISVESFFYLPTDEQKSCFKRNIKIYIKTAPTSFGLITIIRERIIRAKVTVVKIIN